MDKGVQSQFLTEAVQGFTAEFMDILNDRARQDQVLNRLQRITYVHGINSSFVDARGGTWTDTMECIPVQGEFPCEVIEAGKSPDFQRHVAQTITELKASMLRVFYSGLKKITDGTGNVVDGRHFKSQRDVLCEMMEKVELSFDGGTFGGVEIHASRDVAEELEKLQEDPAMQLRLSEIVIRKFFGRFAL